MMVEHEDVVGSDMVCRIGAMGRWGSERRKSMQRVGGSTLKSLVLDHGHAKNAAGLCTTTATQRVRVNHPVNRNSTTLLFN